MTQPEQKLSKKQRTLIDTLAEGLDIAEVLRRCDISPATFHQWVTSEAFRRELAFRQTTACRQSRLLLGQNACIAVRKLITLMDDKDKPDVARRACLDILALVNADTSEPIAPEPPTTAAVDDATAAEILSLLTPNDR